MRLFIAEKPELGRAVAKALGGGDNKQGHIICKNGNDIVTWCFGHLLQLCDPHDYDKKYKKWDMDHLPICHRPWKLKPIHDKKDQLKLIKKLLKDTDEVVNVGDPDPEGQLLIDEVLEYYKNKKPVQRLLINDLNDKSVKKALDSMTNNADYVGLYHSALARSVADQEFGYNMTRSYTLAARAVGINTVLSVGRVQTPILGLVVNRDKIVEAHEASIFYMVKGQFSLGRDIKATYVPHATAPVDDKKRIIDKTYAEQVASACNHKPAKIIDIKSEDKKTKPPLPYNLLTLQVDASKQFGLKADQTLKITQSLREKYKLITYNRSDSQYLNDDQHDDAASILKAVAETVPNYVDTVAAADPSIRSRAFNSANVSAHHAIIPTEATAELEKLSEQEKSIYLLISRQYIAQFYPDHQYKSTSLIIECAGHHFKASSKTILDDGWKSLYSKDKSEDDETEEVDDSDLSTMNKEVDGECTQCIVKEEKTKPLKYYTLATLLTDLTRVSKYVKDPRIKRLLFDKDSDKKGESGGIGTSATRSAIIKTLFDREYIQEKGKTIISTKLGRNFCAVLPDKLTTPDMTALWHEQQLEIESGNKTHLEFLDEISAYIAEAVKEVKDNGLKIEGAQERVECPTCKKGNLIRRPSKKNKEKFWWGCSDYKKGCEATFFDNEGKPIFDVKKKDDSDTTKKRFKCPTCDDGALYQIKGKNGLFWGCTNFKNGCKTTHHDKENKPVIRKEKVA